MTINVVNIRKYDGDDVAYIGRGSPLENIWSSKPSKFKYVKIVENSQIAVDNFRKYLYSKIKEKDRRIVYELKIMLEYYKLNGSLALGCFCKDEYGNGICHGDVIKEVLEKMIKLDSEKSNGRVTDTLNNCSD